jgi:putative ABC transport system ATP-binding protein
VGDREGSDAAQGTRLIEMRGIAKRYGSGPAAVMALAGVDLDVGHAEMVALLGPSGSGKSTLMHILGLLDRPSDGRYRLGGVDVTRLRGGRASRLRGSRVAFVFQAIHLLPGLTALANVELPLAYARMPRAARRERARRALEQVGLGHLAARYPNQLSGGQAQRVAIARAIAPGPQLLLADEPTGALDRRSGETVLGLFQDLHRRLGLTIITVTHDPVVAQHAERAIRLEDGRIVADEAVVGRLRAPSPLGADDPGAAPTESAREEKAPA